MLHHIVFKENKLNMSMNLDVRDGSFALDQRPYQFETCRERFCPHFSMLTPGFFLKHPQGKGYSVATFLKKTEIILKQNEYSQYAMTNRDTVLWIEPTNFWKSCRMRRSLLTIFVRAGMVYDPKRDNYEEALFSEQWAKPTKTAIKIGRAHV